MPFLTQPFHFYPGLEPALKVNPSVAGLVPCLGIEPGSQWDPAAGQPQCIIRITVL